MKLSTIKNIKAFCESLHSEPNWREVVISVAAGEYDFEVDNVRFIRSDEIDEVQQEEMGKDEYILGCFNVDFIAGILDIDSDVIEAMQKAEAFEAIGKLIISLGKLEKMQAEYARLDGYGHHFNSYDSSEEEIEIDGEAFHVFDNR